jgi:hypothetical protein
MAKIPSKQVEATASNESIDLLGSDVSENAGTVTTVFSFSVSANDVISIRALMRTQSTLGTSGGPQFQINIPSGTMDAQYSAPANATGAVSVLMNTSGTSYSSANWPAANAHHLCEISGLLLIGGTGGTVTIRVRRGSSGTVTVRANSALIRKKLN